MELRKDPWRIPNEATKSDPCGIDGNLPCRKCCSRDGAIQFNTWHRRHFGRWRHIEFVGRHGRIIGGRFRRRFRVDAWYRRNLGRWRSVKLIGWNWRLGGR
jgi:hypothetical protein